MQARVRDRVRVERGTMRSLLRRRWYLTLGRARGGGQVSLGPAGSNAVRILPGMLERSPEPEEPRLSLHPKPSEMSEGVARASRPG